MNALCWWRTDPETPRLAFSARVGRRAGDVLGSWSLECLMDRAEEAALANYDAWTADYPGARGAEPAAGQVPRGRFYLHEVREDGYRTYRQAGDAR